MKTFVETDLLPSKVLNELKEKYPDGVVLIDKEGKIYISKEYKTEMVIV